MAAKKNNLKTIIKIPRRIWDFDAGKADENNVVYSAINWDGEATVSYYRQIDKNGVKYLLPSIEVPNEPFSDTLTYVTYEKGRSSCNAIFENEAGEQFHVFMSDFDTMIRHMQNGKISGSFKYVKKGANFGLQMI